MLRGGRFVVEALLISEHSMTKDAVVEKLGTESAEAAMAESDEGVLRTLAPLLGFSVPSTAGGSGPKSGGNKRKGKRDATPPSSQPDDDNSRKKTAKEAKVPVRKSRRLAK